MVSAQELYKTLLHVPQGPQLPVWCMLGVYEEAIPLRQSSISPVSKTPASSQAKLASKMLPNPISRSKRL